MSTSVYDNQQRLRTAINCAVRAAKCADAELLRSYLVHCACESEIPTAIRQLRENCPAIFKR
jgi:hypothetical protein